MIERIERRPVESPSLDDPPPRPRAGAGARRDLVDSIYSEPPELLAFYAGLGKITATTAGAVSNVPTADQKATEKLDAVRASYAGPYQVDGQSVAAPVMFRMGPVNLPSQMHRDELAGIVGQNVARAAQSGQAGPDTIRRATQKLIDAGKLPVGTGDLATRIKQMQWQHGVGVDCACYTRHALYAVSGKGDAALGIAKDYGFRQLDSNPRFTKVGAGDVRPGDVITLDAKPPEIYGHNVIVRSALTSDTYAGMPGTGPFRVIQVDSSWGAGSEGDPVGGYRRDTWIYDTTSKEWGFTRPGTKDFVVSSDGPSDSDKLHGSYRVKP